MALKILGWVGIVLAAIVGFILWGVLIGPIVRRWPAPIPIVIAQGILNNVQKSPFHSIGPASYIGTPGRTILGLRNGSCFVEWSCTDDDRVRVVHCDPANSRETLLLFKGGKLIAWEYHGLSQPVDAEISEVLNQIYPILQSVAEKD